jgi:hypothetical protein
MANNCKMPAPDKRHKSVAFAVLSIRCATFITCCPFSSLERRVFVPLDDRSGSKVPIRYAAGNRRNAAGDRRDGARLRHQRNETIQAPYPGIGGPPAADSVQNPS